MFSSVKTTKKPIQHRPRRVVVDDEDDENGLGEDVEDGVDDDVVDLDDMELRIEDDNEPEDGRASYNLINERQAEQDTLSRVLSESEVSRQLWNSLDEAEERDLALNQVDEWSQIVRESGKLRTLVALLQNLKSESHRTLVFSQSKKMLDIIDQILRSINFTMERIDGGVLSPQERQNRIARFNKDTSIDCFLLTTTAGGVGINLTGADRVVIFDPAWNPATDSQVSPLCVYDNEIGSGGTLITID